MRNLRIGAIGAGYVAMFHCLSWAQVRGMELRGVTAPEGAETLSAFAQKLGIGPAEVFPNVGELAKHVDALAIYSPNFTRLEVMEQIAEAQRAGAEVRGVICEKPLGRTVAEARRMVELARGANLLTCYDENQIHMGAIKVALQQLAPLQEEMGPLVLVRSAEEHSGPHMSWFWDPRQQGGGVLCDMGCHSIAVAWRCLIPRGKNLTFLRPTRVSAEIALLKWGLPAWQEKLLADRGVDYSVAPAEDFATGMITFTDPDTGQIVKAQFTNSWMFDEQGLRLYMDGMGPGYAFKVNSLGAPLNVFVGDVAAEAVADAEAAVEKATASRGLLAVHYNEPDLYGYTDEDRDVVQAFSEGRDAMLDWEYGLEIAKLVAAAYMAAEQQRTIDLTSSDIQRELEDFVPMVAQGRGKEILYR